MMSEDDTPVVETSDFVLAALDGRAMPWSSSTAILRSASSIEQPKQIWRRERADVLGRHVGALGLKELQPRDGDTQGAAHSEITIVRADGRRLRVAQAVSRVEIGGQSRTIAFFRDITSELESGSGWRCTA
jgi:PAS domain-containing protein